MTELSTLTPAEIDGQLADLYRAEFTLEAKLAGALLAIRRGLGQKAETSGRGAHRVETWPTSEEQAVAAMREKGEALIGMMRPASALVAKYDAAAAELTANRETQATLDAEFTRRGGWTRFFQVPGGHVHRTMHCSTCNNGRERTRFDWLIEWSGRNEAEAIAALARAAHVLCSQPCCFPGAPVPATPAKKTAAERAAERAAAEAKARTEDPKLIAAPDGSPLRVDGDPIRTVRTAEMKGVDHLWWAAYARHTVANEQNALEHEAHARQIAEALAHKRGTTAAAELAALVVKALRKLKKELGATEVADPAAAVWARQAEAAAAGDQGDAEAPATAAADDEETATCRYDGAPIFRNRRTIAADEYRRNGGEGWRDDRFDETGRCVAGEQAGPGTPIQHMPAEAPAGDPLGAPAGAGEAARVAAEQLPTVGQWPATEAPAADADLPARLSAGMVKLAGHLDRAAALLGDGDQGDDAACRRCGCTENRACPGGCGWATDDQMRAAGLEPMDGDLCTACLPVPAGQWADAARAAAAAAEGRQLEVVWCEAHGDAPHFERPDCRHPHLTDARTRADMNAAALRQAAAVLEQQAAGPAGDDAELDAAAATDPAVAEVLAAAEAVPAVKVEDPAGLLELVRQYGRETAAHEAAMWRESVGAEQAEAAAGSTLAQIAAVLGLAGAAAAAVPAPRVADDAPPAG
jgi:hypothetical protein